MLSLAGEETYQAPDPEGFTDVQVNPESNRLQILEPFKKWDGKDPEVRLPSPAEKPQLDCSLHKLSYTPSPKAFIGLNCS